MTVHILNSYLFFIDGLLFRHLIYYNFNSHKLVKCVRTNTFKYVVLGSCFNIKLSLSDENWVLINVTYFDKSGTLENLDLSTRLVISLSFTEQSASRFYS